MNFISYLFIYFLLFSIISMMTGGEGKKNHIVCGKNAIVQYCGYETGAEFTFIDIYLTLARHVM